MSLEHNDKITWVEIKKLMPHPKNPNKHSKEQIERLAEIIAYQGFRAPIVVSNRSGFIIAGHGRVEAAIKNKLNKVPVSYQDFLDDEQEYAHMVADNAIADWASLDLAAINKDIIELGPDFNIDHLGIKDFELEPADKYDGESAADGDLYTKKIEAPIYEPKGEKPPVGELCDVEKTSKLIKEIDASLAPEEVKAFLRLAAQRHSVFNYEKIAEYYAHAPAEIQNLMENSALVIIDFNKAIENGFVVLTKDMAEAYNYAEE